MPTFPTQPFGSFITSEFICSRIQWKKKTPNGSQECLEVHFFPCKNHIHMRLGMKVNKSPGVYFPNIFVSAG